MGSGRVWEVVLRVTAVVVASATAVVGLALVVPQAVPPAIDLVITPGRYALVGYFLLYSALLLALAARRRRFRRRLTIYEVLFDAVLGRVALPIVGFIELVLALDGFTAEPANGTVMLLAVPAAASLGFIILSWFERSDAKSETSLDVRTQFKAAVVVPLVLLFHYGLLIAYIVIGIHAYDALGDVLLRHVRMSPGEFITLMPRVIALNLAEFPRVLIVIMVALVAFVFAVQLGTAVSTWWRQRRASRAS